MDEQSITAPTYINIEDNYEPTLRPQTLDDYYGQHEIKENIRILIEAARGRNESLDHLMIYGPPGLGKTTLATIIGNELDVTVRITSGPAIERSGDLASILTNLEDGDILFIDEIHRLHKVVEETLYPAMEDHALDLIVGKGPSARSIRIDLPKFTVIGATTRVGLLSAPMRDRFGALFRLNFYEPGDLAQIILRSADILGTKLDHEAAHAISLRSRGTPRIANRLLKRIRDYAEVKENGHIETTTVDHACELLGVDNEGLDPLDQTYIECIAKTFNGGPVGIETLAAALSEDQGTLEDVVEPFLIQKGYLKKTPRGRELNQAFMEKLL